MDEQNEPVDATKAELRDIVENALKQEQKAEKRRRFDWDVRGLLAVITITGFFAIILAQLIIAVMQGQLVSADKSIRIPAEVAAIVTGVAGFYFGSRSGTSGSDRETAAETQRLVLEIDRAVNTRPTTNGGTSISDDVAAVRAKQERDSPS